jgi:DNA-binding transcriptional regulator PaaX
VRVGHLQKKLLLLLQGGIALSCARTLGAQWKVLQELGKEWESIDRQRLNRAISSLYESKLVDAKRNTDGTFSITLHEDGKKRALRYNIHKMKIQRQSKWDKLWRFISFDIPEDEREVRDSLRGHLLRLGFYEIHQSFFVHAFECRDEVTYVVELYDVKKYVRFITGVEIDNAAHLKKFFGIQEPYEISR